ncbi:MAG: DUF1707 domain-containing protein [Solirubrobacteraceae bacterium]
MRASDADREHVAERLRIAATEGRLLAEELDERLGVALSARTYGELDAVVADLPVQVSVRDRSRLPARPRPAVVLGLVVVTLLIVMAVASTVFGSHGHLAHRPGPGFGAAPPLMWLIAMAVGWRYMMRRRHRSG